MLTILIMTNCRLGDSLVMVPALKALRGHYPDAYVVLCSEQGGTGMVSAKEVLGNRGLIDRFVTLDTCDNWLQRAFKRISFFLCMRKNSWDLGIVLFPPCPPLNMQLVKRLSLYARLCGAKRIVAPTEIHHDDMSVVDSTLRVLSPLGITIPPEGKADARLPLSDNVVHTNLPPGQLLAVAPSANMAVKRWNIDCFGDVLKRLPAAVTPVYFGAESDRERCETLHALRPGVVFVGHAIRDVEAVMLRCSAYFGNDTGLMHLASACGLRCVCLFSGRDAQTVWRPYGDGHRLFRKGDLPCRGCLSQECPLGTTECMNHDVLEVSTALNTLLEEQS